MNPNAYERFLFDNLMSDTGPLHESWFRVNTEYGKHAPDSSNPLWEPNQNGYKPRKGYIDGGIVLKETVTISRHDFTEFSIREWNALEDWAEVTPNIAVKELLSEKLLYIYDTTPVITTMET